MEHDYLDFELRIGARTGDSYPVTVTDSPFDRPSGTLHFVIDEPLRAHLHTVERTRGTVARTRRAVRTPRHSPTAESVSSDERAAMEAIGQHLFRALPELVY